MTGSLVVYSASAPGDARVEDSDRHWCDTRSVYWNGVQRELAMSELARARLVVEGADRVTLEVLGYDVLHPVDAIVRRAAAAGADRIVLADPRRSGLRRRAIRRLRRRADVSITG